jgi:hypothetical protein
LKRCYRLHKKIKATEAAFTYQIFALIIQIPLHLIVHDMRLLAAEVLQLPIPWWRRRQYLPENAMAAGPRLLLLCMRSYVLSHGSKLKKSNRSYFLSIEVMNA